MIQIAEMQKQAVQDEAEKFENMSSWKARILGGPGKKIGFS